MIQQELIDLIELYCMGVQPTDAQFDEITDKAFALGADLQEVTALMEKLQKGPTREQLEAQRRAEEQRAQEEARHREEAARQAELTNYNNAMSLGSKALTEENYAEAIRQFQTALRYRPNDLTATAQLAVAEEKKKKADNSIRARITKVKDGLDDRIVDMKPTVKKGTDLLKENLKKYAKWYKELLVKLKKKLSELYHNYLAYIEKLKNRNKPSK